VTRQEELQEVDKQQSCEIGLVCSETAMVPNSLEITCGMQLVISLWGTVMATVQS
jgi:hypothetical protein